MSTDTATKKPEKSARSRRLVRHAAKAAAAAGKSAFPTPATVASASSASAKVSKINEVIALLSRKNGATLVEITSATGWLPHTARAALTGLRKKGHAIGKTKRDDVSCYSITEGA